MIGDCDPCTCWEDWMDPSAQIVIHMPPDHWRMTERQKELFSWVTCGKCGKVLRYAGTVRSTIPGFKWQTVPMR
jgi:hypothetical protein